MKKLLFLSSLLLFIGCSKNSNGPQTTNLYIDFTHTVSGSDLIMYPFGSLIGEECIEGHHCCGSGLNYTNAAGDNYNIERLWYLISDIYLHSFDGSSKLLKEVHFIDADDRSTFSIDAGELDNGIYSKITFTVGLDSNLNIDNKYVNQSWHDDMFWPNTPMMGAGGYHYMKLEGSFDTVANKYNAHTGPTMAMDMSFDKEFDISLNVDDDLGDVNLSVNMEINNWFQNPNTISFHDFPNGMMGNMNMQHKFEVNGEVDVFSITTINR
jgi:hypothetical protein